MNQALKVLIFIDDERLSLELQKRIKQAWPSVPSKIDRVRESSRAISEFSRVHHDIVITGSELPGIKLDKLILQLDTESGHYGLVVIGSKAPTNLPSKAYFFLSPIVDWTEFLSSLQDEIPDEIRSRYGIQRIMSALYKSLIDYGEKYHDHEKASEVKISILPKRFIAKSKTSLDAESTPVAESHTPTTNQVSIGKERTYAEVGLLIGLFLLTAVLYFLLHDHASLWLLPHLSAALFGLSTVGFFLSRYALAKSSVLVP